MASTDKTPVVVLGAGVIGLTAALLLSRDARLEVTVLAKHMPGDYDAEYASPWAGANYEPMSAAGTNLQEYEQNTWPELQRLAAEVPEAGVHFQDMYIFSRQKDVASPTGVWFKDLVSPTPWFKNTVPEFRSLDKAELPSGIDWGTKFKSVCINSPIYMAWLVSQGLKGGVTFKRGIVKNLAEAAACHASGRRAKLVVNCTGLGSLRLGGVEDTKMYPVRGQVVVVRNEPPVMMSSSGTDDGPDELMYIMNRAAGGGCVLGGCYQAGNWDSQPDPNLAIRIMKRCVEYCPALANGRGIEALSVIRHAVGLRPVREGGTRVEKEIIGDVVAVHCYGHGGYGYQSSYGSVQAAIKLVEESLA